MTRTKPLGSLSLDLDNLWSYMKTHGDAGWERFPSYLDLVVPRILRFLDERGLRITVFVVGQDAALERHRPALAAIAAAGHEIGNHSFHHEPWLHLYDADQVEAELRQAEDAIRAATGCHPRGFRGPGFSLSRAVLEVLHRRGYIYDASTFPTFLGPLARAYYFLKSDLPAAERDKRRHLFGTWRDGLRPVREHRWRLGTGSLLEVPVTTFPYLKLPFHLSYVIYLAAFSPALARGYFRAALWACRLAGVRPSLLLHPLDFLGCDDTEAVAFFPGMNVPAATKLRWVGDYLADFQRHFDVVPLGEHAERIRRTARLPLRPAAFARRGGAARPSASLPGAGGRAA